MEKLLSTFARNLFFSPPPPPPRYLDGEEFFSSAFCLPQTFLPNNVSLRIKNTIYARPIGSLERCGKIKRCGRLIAHPRDIDSRG